MPRRDSKGKQHAAAIISAINGLPKNTSKFRSRSGRLSIGARLPIAISTTGITMGMKAEKAETPLSSDNSGCGRAS